METVLRLLARFDDAGQAGLDATAVMAEVAATDGVSAKDVVRAVAALSRFPVRAVDPLTGVVFRSEVDHALSFPEDKPHPGWIAATLLSGESAAIWIEHTGIPSIVEAALLDSAAEILRSVRFEARRAEGATVDDLSNLLTTRDSDAIALALRRLRLTPETRCRVLARPGAIAQVQVLAQPGKLVNLSPAPEHQSGRNLERIGVGSIQRADQLDRSWQDAQVALAFAAAGDENDPGMSVVSFDDLGLWAQLHVILDNADAPLPDVARLSQVFSGNPWAASTLEAIVSHSSLRLAATALFAHHSTVQSRLAVLEQRLGWDLNCPLGRNRLAMALAARRYGLHPPETDRPSSASPPIIYGHV